MGLRVAIVGYGYVASQGYLPSLQSEPLVDLIAVCDPDPQRCSAAAVDAPGAKAFRTVEELLAAGLDVELVVNTTPPSCHAQVTEQALRAGCHVYSEKPIASSSEEGRRLVHVAGENGRQLLVAPDTMTCRWFSALRDIVESGELGVLHSAYGRVIHSMNVTGAVREPWMLEPMAGALEDVGIYPIAELTALLGPVRTATAVLRRIVPRRLVRTGQVEDAHNSDGGQVLLSFDEASAVIEVATSCAAGEEYLLVVRGTRGSARVRGVHPEHIELDRGSGQVGRHPVDAPDRAEWCRGVVGFARFLGGLGPRPRMDIGHGLHVAEVIEACNRSARTHRTEAVRSRFGTGWLQTASGGR